MKAEKLKEIIKEAIAENSTLYQTAIAPALAESGLSSADIICGYAELAHLKISKTQLRWLQKDQDLKQSSADRYETWKADGLKIYGLEDFPEWVIDRLNALSGNAQGELRRAAQEIMDQDTDSMPILFQDAPEQFSVIADRTYFTEKGYQYLMMTCEARGWMNHQEWRQWKQDSGLFAQV